MTAPQYATFQEWFSATVDAAGKTPVGIRMIANGYNVAHLGGNTLGWEKYDASGAFQILVTVSESDTSPGDELGSDLAEPATTRWIAGIHDDNGDCYGDEVIGLDAALALAAKYYTNPASYIELGKAK